jgi:hypothetical protein
VTRLTPEEWKSAHLYACGTRIANLEAMLDAERATHAALVEAADAVCQAWIADEAGEETFDPNLIDALGDALYGKPEDRAALTEEASK